MKRKWLHSLAAKNTLYTWIVGFTVLILLTLTWPRLFYHIAKGELLAYTRNTLSECAVRMSYLLNTHRSIVDLKENISFCSLLERSYEDPQDTEALEKLQSYLGTSQGGLPIKGSIQARNLPLFIVNMDTCFTRPSLADLGEAFMAEPILGSIHLDEEGAFTSDQMRFDDLGNSYCPLLWLENEGEKAPYFCFLSGFFIEEMPCLCISLTPFSDVAAQLSSLESIGLMDYGLFGGDFLLFQNQEDSSLPEWGESWREEDPGQYTVYDYEEKGVHHLSVLCSYPSEELFLAASCSWLEMIQPFHRFFTLLELALVFLIVLLSALHGFITSLGLRRLHKLDQEMEKIRGGDLNVFLPVKGDDELANTAATINQMIFSIRSHLEHKIELEKQEKYLQYTILVSAMDPHFIYNTLDTVSFLAAMNKCEDIIKVNTALIGTLKDRIKVKSLRIFDTLEKEREVLRQYMVLVSYLYASPITLTFEAEEDSLSCQIPKNLLQPLVENSIKHGLLTHKDESRRTILPGFIHILVSAEGENLIITLQDNGIGFPAEVLDAFSVCPDIQNLNPEHIGLANTFLRLSYLYGESYSFHLENRPEGGAQITITLPREAPQVDFGERKGVPKNEQTNGTVSP